MKKAIVLGGTGGMGQALVKELLAQGIPTTAFGRSEEKLNKLVHQNQDKAELLSIYAGDAFNSQEVAEASKGADVIFHSVNIPYPQWEHKLVSLAESIMQAATIISARVVVVDNIYHYGHSQMERVTEDHPKLPHTKKGKIRLKVEQVIMQAHREGTPALITRLPDFYGPHSESSILNMTLQSIALGKSGVYVGKKDIPREFIYLPDGAKAIVKLAEQEDAFGENWNIPGAGVITGAEIFRVAQEVARRPTKSIQSIGRKMFFLLGMFNPMMKEVREMLYLTENPVILNGEKVRQRIGSIPATPYEEGIKTTIHHYQNHTE